MKKRNGIFKGLSCWLLAGTLFCGSGGFVDAKEYAKMKQVDVAQECFCLEASDWELTAEVLETEQEKTEGFVWKAEDLSGLKVYPGGFPFGIKFMTEGIHVVGFCDIEKGGKKCNPAMEAGLKIKDVILSAEGKTLESAAQLGETVEASEGKPLTLTCRRGKTEFLVTLTPIYCEAEGRYQSGMWVRDSGAGIGTVTFVLPESGCFAGLGHGICEAETGELVKMRSGSVSDVVISSVKKGAAGAPGELKGYFTPGKKGALLGNTACGVFGVLKETPESLGELVEVGSREELCEGSAEILCTLTDNKVGKYTVEITNVQREATGAKCFCVKVTDPALLALSGGIVQGMSGSPILQNGKLMGAVTHVLINDPTSGYGIFFENMLSVLPMQNAKSA